jgi:hypothetical protein
MVHYTCSGLRQNKANGLRADRQWARGDETGPAGAAGPRRTKRSQLGPVRSGLGGQVRKTNPISGSPTGGPGGPVVQTHPISGVGRLCETNPIRHRRAGRTIPKAAGLEAATRAGGKCAKRTQLPEGGTEAVSGSRRASGIPSMPLFYHSTIQSRCRGVRPSASSEDCACRCPPSVLPLVRAFAGGGWWICWRVVVRLADNYNGRRTGCAGHRRIPLVMR